MCAPPCTPIRCWTAGNDGECDILRRHNGWKCMGVSEDAEFTLQAMLKRKRTRYVPDAIVYEDQPSTLRDTVNRTQAHGKRTFQAVFYARIALFREIFYHLPIRLSRPVPHLLFVPIAVVACTWFPLYYGYKIIAAAVLGDTATLIMFGKLIGYILLFAFYLPFTLQSLLAALLEESASRSLSQIAARHISFPAVHDRVRNFHLSRRVFAPDLEKDQAKRGALPRRRTEEPPQEGKACDASDQEIKSGTIRPPKNRSAKKTRRQPHYCAAASVFQNAPFRKCAQSMASSALGRAPAVCA